MNKAIPKQQTTNLWKSVSAYFAGVHSLRKEVVIPKTTVLHQLKNSIQLKCCHFKRALHMFTSERRPKCVEGTRAVFEVLEAYQQFQFRDFTTRDDSWNYFNTNINPNSIWIGAEEKVFARPVPTTAWWLCFWAFAVLSRWINFYQTASFGSADINQEILQPIAAELQGDARLKHRSWTVTRLKTQYRTCQIGTWPQWKNHVSNVSHLGLSGMTWHNQTSFSLGNWKANSFLGPLQSGI
jgi:hypothetical protein